MTTPHSSETAHERMKDLATPASRGNAALCALALGLAIVISYPIAPVPFGDDFSYTQTALDFARTGHILYNGWATAMLGWQVLWGALFIKLFGFSFTVVRMSTWPVAMASVYLFHQILVRFGISARNAVLGSLAFGLSPLFFLIATTYLTDIPGTFVLVLCMYMCQRAVVAPNRRSALLWLVFAGVVNIIGGTVRQTSWFGVLVMVPSTAWLLRRQRGMLLAGAVTGLGGAICIFLCMHWANHQPFFVPELMWVTPKYIYPLSVVGKYGKALLCLLFVLIPILASSFSYARRLSPIALIRTTALLAVSAGGVLLHSRGGWLEKSLAPWLIPFIQVQCDNLPPWIRIVFSLLTPAAAWLFAELLLQGSKDSANRSLTVSPHWKAALWIGGPVSLAYLIVLFPRAATTIIQDRYLLGILPAALVLVLLVFEFWIAPQLSNLSIAFIALFALFTVASSHDLYAALRAAHAATEELLVDGVPRTAIIEGFAPDLWNQLEAGGYINSGNMVSASTKYNPHVVPWDAAPECMDQIGVMLHDYEPTLHPKYIVRSGLDPCFAPTRYPTVNYSAWLPPFHRTFTPVRILPASK